jgi:hypothetical protein
MGEIAERVIFLYTRLYPLGNYQSAEFKEPSRLCRVA